MASRTVRLDDDTGEILEQLSKGTGLSTSAVVKQSLIAFRDRMGEQAQRSPYDIYQELDLGPGGYAVAPSTESRRGVQEAIRRKLKR
jgi:hypothetical protein